MLGLPVHLLPVLVAALVIHLEAASVVASEATGEGPEYRYGGAATFRTSFSRVGSARNASSEEYAFEKPATRMTFS